MWCLNFFNSYCSIRKSVSGSVIELRCIASYKLEGSAIVKRRESLELAVTLE